jgi:hypothetical protein
MTIDKKSVEIIQNLRKKGHSLDEIHRMVDGVSRRTVAKYIREVQLTEEQKKRLELSSQRGMRKGQMDLIKRTTKKIKPQTGEITLSKVRIISHLLFDGHVEDKKWRVFFTCSSPKIIKQFINDVKEVYGLTKHSIVNENNKGCYSIVFSSILMVKDLKTLAASYSCKSENIRVPQFIKEGTIEFKREFLRCFWSDEGGLGIIQKTKQFTLVATQTNIAFLKEIANIHEEFGIHYTLSEKKFQIFISRKAEKQRFAERIGFLDGSLVTRGNYIGREKNELLAEMLMQ